MGFGSKLKKTVKRVTKQVKRSADQVYKQAVRSVNDFTDTVVQAGTGGTISIGDNWNLRSGEGLGKVTTEVRDNWTKYRMPLAMAAGTALLATGAGAAAGAGLFAMGLSSAATVGAAATTGAVSGLATGAATGAVVGGSQANAEHDAREAAKDEAEYAATVERQNQANELASQIQSSKATTVNPSAYYNIYSKYGRGGRF